MNQVMQDQTEPCLQLLLLLLFWLQCIDSSENKLNNRVILQFGHTDHFRCSSHDYPEDRGFKNCYDFHL